MKKIGSETPASAIVIENRSKMEPRFSAETTPMPMPAISQIIAAPMASDRVTGMSLTIAGQTGCWFLNE